MKTDVTIAGTNKESIIAYKNNKNQNVFIVIHPSAFGKKIKTVWVANNKHSIDDILIKGYKYPNAQKFRLDIGIKYKHIWKPMLNNIPVELNIEFYDISRAKRNLLLLLQKLQDILLYVEPSNNGLMAYGHKLRELLILACTDLECMFKNYSLDKNRTTNDYVQLLNFVDLKKYQIELVGYTNKFISSPFYDWKATEPSKSLLWYDAYNLTKHNAKDSFYKASLQNCLDAVCANIIMFCVRYSPYLLYHENDSCSNLVKNMFSLNIADSMDTYIPIFEGAGDRMEYAFHKFVVEDGYGETVQLPFEEREK